MKVSIFITALASTASAKNIMGTSEVSRSITGDWVKKFYRRSRRGDIVGEKGFRPMAAMKLYLSGMGKNKDDPENSAHFEIELGLLEETYTSYGCYCWINGMADGVIGGGKAKDVTDHHCKELYRCYKCVNNDYQKTYTDVSYAIEFTMEDGKRALDCSINSKQDAENICLCDKRFAESIVATENACQNNDADDVEFGGHCLNEEYRTANGNGFFDPNTQCEKQFQGHDRNNCCGLYPNRYPYDMDERDCCRTNIVDSNSTQVENFTVQQKGVCEGAGGDIVISAEGDPHNYINLSGTN